MPSPVTAFRSPCFTPLWLTTNGGLEDVAAREFEERASRAGLAEATASETPGGCSGYVLASAAAPPEAMLGVARAMRSIHHVTAPLYTFELDAANPLDELRATVADLDVPAMASARTFRVTTNRKGSHDFTSVDVQRVAGAALQERYGTEVDLEAYDAEVRVDVWGGEVTVGLQHTTASLSQRHARVFEARATLKPNVAYGLLRLPRMEQAPHVILDPFCGSGTLILEAAAHWPRAHLVGTDWDERVVAGARVNAWANGLGGALRRGDLSCGDLSCDDHAPPSSHTRPPLARGICLRQSDAREVSGTLSGLRADLVVTNPPYGERLGRRMSFLPFYEQFLEEMHRVLRPGGWLVLLVGKNGPFNTAVRRSAEAGFPYDVRHVRVINAGGLYPHAFVLQRSKPPQ